MSRFVAAMAIRAGLKKLRFEQDYGYCCSEEIPELLTEQLAEEGSWLSQLANSMRYNISG